MTQHWVRFLVVGLGVFALDASVFLLLEKAGFSIALANAAGMLLGWLAGLVLHQRWTFSDVAERLNGCMVLRHAGALVVNWALGTGLVILLVQIECPLFWAKVLATAVVTVCSFLLARYFVFVRK